MKTPARVPSEGSVSEIDNLTIINLSLTRLCLKFESKSVLSKKTSGNSDNLLSSVIQHLLIEFLGIKEG